MILVRVLGPVELSIDGTPPPADLLWRKNVALMVYLARAPGRARTREQIIGLLWGEKPETAARHSLNEALRTIRRHAGDDSLDTSGGQIRLSPDAVHLDIDSMEELVGHDDLESAGNSIAGLFMEGFSVPDAWEFEEWLSAERRLWKRRGTEILCELAAARVDRGDTTGAADAAQHALALDSTCEPACRAAMKAMALGGDRSGALALFDEFAQRLLDVAAIDPDDKTVELATRIRTEKSWPVPAPGRAVRAGSRRAPLFDRDKSLAAALAVWSSCLHDSRASVLVVEGEAGSGKTRFMEEFVARTRLDGALTSQVRAVEADVHEPWSTVGALTRALLAAAPAVVSDSPAHGRIRALASDSIGPEAWSARLVSTVLLATTMHAPLVLVIDDAHWADAESIEALEGALRDVADRPLLIAFSTTLHHSRAGLDGIRSRIGRETAGGVVRVLPLHADAVRALARWAFPSYGDTEIDRLARRIWMDSAGLPLLAVELIHAVAIGLDLHAVQGAWPRPLQTLDQTYPADLPDGVTAALRMGFRRLSADAREVLVAASVLGDRVGPEMLGAATGLSREPLERALDELEFERWLSSEPRGYSFVARIARLVIARDMATAGKRRRIEERTCTPDAAHS